MYHHDSDRRLVIIHNPNSTGARHVRQEVFSRLVEAGESFDTIQTRYTTTQANTNDIAAQLRDGDRVISAAGDGTASQLMNAVASTGVDAEVGFLPYGNFNDLAFTHMKPRETVMDLLHSGTADLWPLSVYLDSELWRYAPGYVTIGWTAIAASQFDDLSSRGRFHQSPRSLTLARSLTQLAGNYAKYRAIRLPHFTSDVSTGSRAVTDVLAVNNPRVAHIVRSETNYYDGLRFGYKEVDMARIVPNLAFGARALAGRAPFTPLRDISLHFDQPAHLPIQTEGEFARVDAQLVTITKQEATVIKVLDTKITNTFE